MKRIAILSLAFMAMVTLLSCHWWMGTVHGNGHVISETKNISGFSKVSFGGPLDVEITPGADYAVRIVTDENLLKYIHVDKDGSRLKIKVRSSVNLHTPNGIKVFISMPNVNAISFAGSGKLHVNGVIKNDDKVSIETAGSCDLIVGVDCPGVESEIAGSGSISLSGQTRTAKIGIAGSGDYKAEELKTEETEIDIAGSGSARVYTSMRLKVSISGSGDVYYKGNPADINQSVAGSGNIKPIQ